MNDKSIYSKDMILLHNKVAEYCRLKDYGNALRYSQMLVKLFEEKGCTDTADGANELFIFGFILDRLGKYSDALKAYKGARDILKDSQPNSPVLARVMNNIGIILAEHGKKDGAIRHLTRAGVIEEKLHGRNSREYADVLYNLGSVHFMNGDYTRAAIVYTESMKIFQARDITLVDNFCCLGHCLEKLSNSSQASCCFENALLLVNNTGIGTLRDKFSIKLYIAGIRLSEGNLEEALRLYKELKEEISDTIGIRNMQYVECLDKLSRIYGEIDGKAAIEYKYGAIKALEKITSKKHFVYTEMLKELAELLKNNGDSNGAMDIISEYMTQAEQEGDIDTDAYVRSAYIQADILNKQKKVNDAIKLLERVVFNCSSSRNGYIKCLLMLVHLYLEYGCGKDLYGVYDRFVKVKPGNSFDDMLDMSEDY